MKEPGLPEAAILESEGWLLRASGLAVEELDTITRASELATAAAGRGGRRLALQDLPAPILALPMLEAWRGLVENAVGGSPRIVRALLFDKSDTARWRVGWHRDRVVPLLEARAVGGFSAPSLKAGQPHARAPRAVLEQMLALRLHLDDADEGNGCLLVVPGSHLSDEDPQGPGPELVRALPAPAGHALLMRPLLLHASAKPSRASRRRVLHLDLAGAKPLPEGLKWPSASDARSIAI